MSTTSSWVPRHGHEDSHETQSEKLELLKKVLFGCCSILLGSILGPIGPIFASLLLPSD